MPAPPTGEACKPAGPDVDAGESVPAPPHEGARPEASTVGSDEDVRQNRPKERHHWHGGSSVGSSAGSEDGDRRMSVNSTGFASSEGEEATIENLDSYQATMSALQSLPTILKGQFGELPQDGIEESDSDDGGPPRRTSAASTGSARSSRNKSRFATLTSLPAAPVVTVDTSAAATMAVPRIEADTAPKRKWAPRMVDSKWFIAFFMLWTIYALCASDLDLLYGDKETKHTLSIINSVVFLLFGFELVVQCLGRKGYTCKAYFWLDMIALITMLQDTWFMQEVHGNDAFLAGRSTKVTRILRLAARSSKTTRLNRLFRIIRVASLMPRLGKALGRRVDNDESGSILDKKLRRIFNFLDEDMDSQIPFLLAKNVVLQMNEQANTADSNGTGVAERMSQLMVRSMTAGQSGGRRLSGLSAGLPGFTGIRTSKSNIDTAILPDPDEPVSFKGFREMVLQDPALTKRLLRACRKQAKQANNMKNITSSYSEYIAVKVALAVLFLLLILQFAEPGLRDFAPERGLDFCSALLREDFSSIPNTSAASLMPALIREQVHVWEEEVCGVDRQLLYMDIEKKVYCNEFMGESCNGTLTAFAGRRASLESMDVKIFASDYRIVDLFLVRVPDLLSEDISAEELNARTQSVAVVFAPEDSKLEAIFSLATTGLVIMIILGGVSLLTNDMAFLSGSLLRPLRELADDMESIAQLQLAGMSNTEESIAKTESTSEVKLIRRTFENMKKAIKSWGKYVPWPVVRILLRANIEAELEVHDVEVTSFFSDIAGFTSIVEKIPPEASLLLLSRYFNDMTQVIDSFGGVVLEFIGDAILCIYGAPVESNDHPQAGVQAALRMFTALNKMNKWCIEKDLPEVDIRCGVHTGRVLVGNMGFHSRMKYGIVGEDSQISSHLEELNKTYSTNMMISNSTYERLPVGKFHTRPLDYLRLRQAGAPETVHEVLRNQKVSRRIVDAMEIHANAMDLYLARDFAAAAEKFDEVGRIERSRQRSDAASALMLARCEAYQKTPPPASWDGVWEEPAQKILPRNASVEQL